MEHSNPQAFACRMPRPRIISCRLPNNELRAAVQFDGNSFLPVGGISPSHFRNERISPLVSPRRSFCAKAGLLLCKLHRSRSMAETAPCHKPHASRIDGEKSGVSCCATIIKPMRIPKPDTEQQSGLRRLCHWRKECILENIPGAKPSWEFFRRKARGVKNGWVLFVGMALCLIVLTHCTTRMDQFGHSAKDSFPRKCWNPTCDGTKRNGPDSQKVIVGCGAGALSERQNSIWAANNNSNKHSS